MSGATPETTQLLLWLEQMQAGDAAAQEALLRHCGGRLERLTRKMLQDYPGVKRWEQTDDVLQNAMLRLLRSLREVRPASSREFFGLATLQIRRELLDLAKHYYGPQGSGAHHASLPEGHSAAAALDRADSSADPSRLAQWCEIHRQVDRLPPEEREVFGLLYYQSLTQQEAAAILKVSKRTIQRHWQQALLKLHDFLRGDDAPL
jgi:RNA polymerase sigma-70 factor (ECF subfamily)